VVDPKHQKQGIGRMLIDVTVLKAKELGFKKLYQSHPVTAMEVTL
jgi:GNAT superfamily N-acetyltransferase